MKCIKSLYKSTYKRMAFLKNKKYTIAYEDDYVCVVDEMNREFNFSRTKNGHSYVLSDYFDEEKF
jgi:hypothetical protein